jgi:hypothetical protein
LPLFVGAKYSIFSAFWRNKKLGGAFSHKYCYIWSKLFHFLAFLEQITSIEW